MRIDDVLVIPRSGDSKTGPIPVTYRPLATCPPTCPLYPVPGESGGCYGTGRLFGFGARARDDTVADILERIGPHIDRSARIMRDRIVGDLAGRSGRMSRRYVRAVSAVADGLSLPLFGYTHMWDRMSPDDVRYVRDLGYTLNASVHTGPQVVAAIGRGFPVALASDTIPDGTRIAGRTVVLCPAVKRPGITCNDCRLCGRWDRSTIVRFPLHGPARNLARAAIERLSDVR